MPTPITDLSAENRDKRTLEVQVSGLRAKLKEATERAAHWHHEFEAKQADFESLAAIREPVQRTPIVPARQDGSERQGVVLVNWSDWHVGEVVDKRKVRGLNSYSPEIARKRARQCAESTMKLWRYIRSSYNVDSMVLFLGGDFISGYLHEELAQTNAMAPVEETRYAKELLIDALDHVVAEKTLKHLRIVGMRGNHGRTSRKMQFKNDYETSYESWLYWDLQDRYDDDQRVLFDIPRGDVHIVPVASKFNLRLYHGHQIKYSDGVGGLTIPLNKWQAKQDQIVRADFNLMGHYHMWSMPNSRTILSGSLKGWDEYAASHGFAYQEPLQTFALIDTKRRMLAQNMPIFCT